MDDRNGSSTFISYSDSDTIEIAPDAKNIMDEEVVGIHQVEEPDKQEEVSLQDASCELNPNSVGMGALANAAAGKVEAGAKRPIEFAEEDAAKKPKYEHEQSADPEVWESLMTQVRGQLLAMSSDECFSKALELQMLARAEVGNRSQHLYNAMDLMANSQAGLSKSPAKPIIMRENPPNTTMTTNPPITDMATNSPNTTMAPPRCEVDNAPDVELPAFCQLVNFPTARYYGNCVMCDESEFSIPKQNKGVCNNCDVAIWVVNPSGMNIKWCKGCKNFRKWIDFGMKVCLFSLVSFAFR